MSRKKKTPDPRQMHLWDLPPGVTPARKTDQAAAAAAAAAFPFQPLQTATLTPEMMRRLRSPLPLHKKRLRGSPHSKNEEFAKRDIVLDVLAERRAALIASAKNLAIQRAREKGRVTSVEVFGDMRAQGLSEYLDACDPRWMGVVFRDKQLWKPLGYWERSGSHGRPVRVWGLAA